MVDVETIIYDKDITRNVILRTLYEKGIDDIPDSIMDKIVEAVEIITEEQDYEKGLRVLHSAFLRLPLPNPLDVAGECIAKIDRVFNTLEEEDKITKIVRRVIEEMKREGGE